MGRVEKEKLDSFNIPMYWPSTEELKQLVQQNGLLHITDIHLFEMDGSPTDESPESAGAAVAAAQAAGESMSAALRAGTGPLIKCHFVRLEFRIVQNALLSTYCHVGPSRNPGATCRPPKSTVTAIRRGDGKGGRGRLVVLAVRDEGDDDDDHRSFRPLRLLRLYRSAFGLSPHPVAVSQTPWLTSLHTAEAQVLDSTRPDAADRLLRLLMLTPARALPLHLVARLRLDLGLAPDFPRSLLPNYPDYYFALSRDGALLDLVCYRKDLAVSAMQSYAQRTGGYKVGDAVPFPLSFPRGFELDKKLPHHKGSVVKHCFWQTAGARLRKKTHLVKQTLKQGASHGVP
uniref:PORR domain-containing protein n=1 Tax=Oryza brachyantha TaxID=4533 RepID=J3N7A7_ORYBR